MFTMYSHYRTRYMYAPIYSHHTLDFKKNIFRPTKDTVPHRRIVRIDINVYTPALKSL